MRNDSGTTLAETVMAFSIWSMISLILIPASMYISQEREKTRLKHEAVTELQSIIEKRAYKEGEHNEEGKDISWSASGELEKACIEWSYKGKLETECLYSFRP
ncbi:hypothetical protein [Metabacillus indicus]|uniref:Uncharacterized protein n=1 Tax=Metabacillus indicus TaxID=246786 RepID=A0A084GWH5_METID|nr:hypothetical protein [Metabacillus indicus]KEZ50999.1 hypothetical protein AZ46_0210295 [Metabacillus indicus LMG 22858]KEZ51687.1 hypothetical protein GS18_0211215 [Metabacillus indicus]